MYLFDTIDKTLYTISVLTDDLKYCKSPDLIKAGLEMFEQLIENIGYNNTVIRTEYDKMYPEILNEIFFSICKKFDIEHEPIRNSAKSLEEKVDVLAEAIEAKYNLYTIK